MLRGAAKGIKSLISTIVLVIMLPVASQEDKCRYGKEDISFGKFYKAATRTNRRFLKDIFITIFYRSHVTFVESWPSSVEDYCFDILGWSRKKYRDSFNAEERKALSVPVESMDGDVSLLNKLILKLFSDINLPGTFTNALREVKNIRNRVCHDQLDFTDDVLQSNMEDLKHIFKTLLSEVKETFSIDVNCLQENYCDEVDGIMASPITGEGMSYFEKMESFREDLMGKFIAYGRKELISFYSKLKVLNPFTWLSDDKFSELQVDKIFTPLHISDRNIMTDVESLLIYEPIDEDNNQLTGILPSVVVLTGIAGCGKTSLCRYLLYDWRTRLGNISNMRSVDLLILIEARNLTTHSLVSYLQRSLLKETCSYFEEKDILPTLQKLNVLYVVDGMDEATEDGRKLLDELFSVLGNSRVVLTTRPEFTSSVIFSVLNHHHSYTKLCIHGFSEKGIAKFTSKVFQSLECNEQKRNLQEAECLRFLMTTGRLLGDHLKIPLTLALLIILWRDDRSSFTEMISVTKLYSEIFKMCSMKMLSRVRRNTSSTCLDLESFVEEWLFELGKIAYVMVKKDDYFINDDKKKFLRSICNKYCVDSIHVLSAFLICEVQEGLGGVQYQFSFIHKSQMEYLAGHYNACMLISNFEKKRNPLLSNGAEKIKVFQKAKKTSEPSFQEIMELRKMTNVFMFTIGNLCLQKDVNNELVIDLGKQLLMHSALARKVSFLWQFVQESNRHPQICEMVGDSLYGNYIWKPEGEELCNPVDPTLQLLKYTHFTPKGLMIRIVDDTHSMKIVGDKDQVERRPYTNLIPILQNVSKHPEVDIVLRVDQHYYNWGDQETTDFLLEAFSPKGKLTGFMGHLGLSGAKSLASFGEIYVMNVRISNVETLHALCKSLTSMSKLSDLEMTVRLDIPQTVLPMCLPTFKCHLVFNIIMTDIDDESVMWATEIVAQLNTIYNEVRLLSSRLTFQGGDIFLRTLSEKNIVVKDRIYISSPHSLNNNDFRNLEKLVDCTLEWW